MLSLGLCRRYRRLMYMFCACRKHATCTTKTWSGFMRSANPVVCLGCNQLCERALYIHIVCPKAKSKLGLKLSKSEVFGVKNNIL